MVIRPSKTGASFKARKYQYSAEDIKRWRNIGWSWPRIARKYGCDHTTLMYAAFRLGVLGPLKGVNTRRKREAILDVLPKASGVWPAGICFQDAKIARRA